MNQDTFIYTLPQWFIFSAVVVIVYGWVEHKKAFRMIGSFILVLLGIFAIYSIVNGYFSASHFMTPNEMMSEELDNEIIEEVPFQARLLPAYWSFIISAALAIPAIIFDWKNIKPNRLFIVLAVLVSLFGFFVIVGELKML